MCVTESAIGKTVPYPNGPLFLGKTRKKETIDTIRTMEKILFFASFNDVTFEQNIICSFSARFTNQV